MSGGMSSIRTGTAPGSSAAGRRCAAARSASLSAAQIQLTSASGATAASPEVTPATRPPPPRRAVSVPSGPNWYDTGPRLDATRTRLFIAGRVVPCRTSPPPGPAPGRADTLISVQTQLHNAHPEGWRDRPCEAPATYRASMPVAGGPAQYGGARDMVPSPARGQGDRWERWGKEVLAGDHSNTIHPPSFPVRLCHGADLPRMRPGGRARPVLRLHRVLRAAGGRLRLPAAGPGGPPGGAHQT